MYVTTYGTDYVIMYITIWPYTCNNIWDGLSLSLSLSISVAGRLRADAMYVFSYYRMCSLTTECVLLLISVAGRQHADA